MRQISVSTEVFSLIWSLRQPGEECEDQILRRALAGINPSSGTTSRTSQPAGILDRRSGVLFPEGFEVLRRIRGQEVRAVVNGGVWWIPSLGFTAPSLNALGRKLSPTNENAWQSWFYTDPEGRTVPVSNLRRKEPTKEHPEKQTRRRGKRMEQASESRWCDDVRDALTSLSGRAHLEDIYCEVEKIRRQEGRSIPPSLRAVVRKELEQRSSDSEAYLGGDDWFEMAGQKGEGIWRLRKYRS